MPYITEAEAQINVRVDQVPTLPATRSWSTFEGGDPEGDTSILFPGAGIAAVAVPGPVKRSQVTASRPYTSDLHAVVSQLEAAVNSTMSVWYTPTDADGNALPANTVTYTGILRKVTKPKFDASSGKPAMFSVTMECNT